MAPRRPPTSLLPPLEPLGSSLLCPSVADELPHPPTQGCRHQGRGLPLTLDVRPGALTPWRSLSPAWDPPRGGQLLGGQAEPQAPSSAFHAHAFVHLRPPPSRDKFNQQLLWPPEGPQCAAGCGGSGRPSPGPRGCRAEFRARHRPAPDDSRRPGPRSPPRFFPEPQLTLSTSSFQSCRDHSRTGQQGGRGQRSAGEGNGGGGRLYPRARAPAPAPNTPPQPLPTPPRFPTSPRQPHQELRLGGRPGVRGRGALTSQSIQPHMPHAGRGHSQLGSPAWVSPTGKPPGSDWGLQGDRASPTPP